MVDYFLTNLAGKENVLQIHFQSITTLMPSGYFLLEAPTGFAIQENCAVLESLALEEPFQDLAASGANLQCSSLVLFTTQHVQVTIFVSSGTVKAAAYSFGLSARNPLVPERGLLWTISSFANPQQIADLSSTVEGFQVETPMLFGALLGRDSGISYSATRRDDHPGQVTNVILAFELSNTPSFTGAATLVVKAPPGFQFPSLCSFMVVGDIFGDGIPFPAIYFPFDPSAVVSSCQGHGHRAELQVGLGLRAQRRYVLRLEVVNPEQTSAQNFWSISFSDEASEPFEGYRLWRFDEVSVTPSAIARSTLAEETPNNVTILFRTTNALPSTGFLAIQAPFGFRIPTNCHASLVDALADHMSHPVSCRGTASPSNIGELHVANELMALGKYELALLCVNPTIITLEAGTWQLQSYSTKQADYAALLDLGQVRGFRLTEVFHTLKVVYPVTTALDELELRIQILLYTALESGDVLQITAPDGYDFSGNGTDSCSKYRRYSTTPFPSPGCQSRSIRFILEEGLGLLDLPGSTERLTPLLDFSVATWYPRKTLSAQATVFQGEQLRGSSLVAAKSIFGQLVTPRLLELSVSRVDQKVTMTSLSTLRLTFRVSQDAEALHITTVQDVVSQDEDLRFDFSVSRVTEPTEVPVTRNEVNLLLEMQMLQGLAYGVTVADVRNPLSPGTALWTLSTFVFINGVLDENVRDRSVNLLGPVTLIRLNMLEQTDLTDPFFDIANTEFFVAFSLLHGVSAGQILELRAPQGFRFLERSFSPGEGFPLISGQVFLDDASPDPNVPFSSRPSLAVQMLTPLVAGQIVRFSVRLRTPAAPEDLALWDETHQSSWLLRTCRDRPCEEVTASNDDLFPGFVLKASFGSTSLTPQANGVAPQLSVTVTLAIHPKASLASLLQGGTVHVRIRAPLGFDFAASCLAVTPNRVFERCEGDGRVAVLLARDGELAAGFTSVALFVTNAAMTPAERVGNTWVLESFVDFTNTSMVVTAPSDQARQRSQVPGYEIRELLEATIGGNTQRAAVTMVFVWFLASQFLDVGGAVQLHAPPSYELRCTPRVQYISLPAGSCRLLAGVTSSTGDVYHQYLSLALTLPGQQVYPNTAYEFGVAATNPAAPISPNYWGLVLLKPGSEVVDSTRTLPGYELTDYHLLVQAPLPSSTRPAVVNMVQLDITFLRQLQPGEAAHITVLAPSTSKVLCQRFSDVTGGGNLAAALPLDNSVGTYGTHTCQLQNSLTMHLDISRPVLAGSYDLRIGVLNPGMRAAKDFWTVELIKEVTDWRTAPAMLKVQMNGFGVSQPFVKEIAPIAAQAQAWSIAWSLYLFKLVLQGAG
ncbi:unnamed protein product [Durusdinium trenchii]|uniref:Uncharacterized protein n=1 Tax=Durusdinium trenchii TaxID=1381693 RepID=A0ABP0IHP2_9DINO